MDSTTVEAAVSNIEIMHENLSFLLADEKYDEAIALQQEIKRSIEQLNSFSPQELQPFTTRLEALFQLMHQRFDELEENADEVRHKLLALRKKSAGARAYRTSIHVHY